MHQNDLTIKDEQRVVERLLKEEELCLSWTDYRGWPLLHNAVMRNNPNITAMILAHETIKVNFDDGNCETALHLAAKHSNTSVMRLLLGHHDIEVNRTNFRAKTALHYTVKHNNEEGFNLLIHRKDIDVNACISPIFFIPGETVLQTARQLGRTEMVEMLLARGAHETAEPDAQSEKVEHQLEGNEQLEGTVNQLERFENRLQEVKRQLDLLHSLLSGSESLSQTGIWHQSDTQQEMQYGNPADQQDTSTEIDHTEEEIDIDSDDPKSDEEMLHEYEDEDEEWRTWLDLSLY